MHLTNVRMRLSSVLAVAPLLLPLAVRAEPAPPATGAPSAGPSSVASKPPPGEVEIIDVTEEPVRSSQWLAVGLALGGGYLVVKSEAGHGAVALDAAVTIDFGLGPGGDPSTWTLGPYLAAAFTPFGDPVPNRFAEIGARLVRRFEAPMWVSLGLGLAFTNHKAVLSADDEAKCQSGKADPGFDCGLDHNIIGGLLDLGVGFYEVRARTARWGVGARVPVQLSAHPGVGALVFVYGTVGVGR